MKMRARGFAFSICWGLCASSLVFFVVLPGPAHAQQISPSFAQGTHLFRRLLYDLHLQPLQSIPQLNEEPGEKLLIILGETEFLSRIDWDGLENFVQRGGAVLLATDRYCRFVLRPFHVQVVGDLVISGERQRDRKFAYKDARDCVFIEAVPSEKVPLFENLSVDNHLSRVATNRPGFLRSDPDCRLSLLATFPPGCYAVDRDTLKPRSRVEIQFPARRPILPFAMGGKVGLGRIVLLSDHSVFINAMMWQTDNENFDFAYNCVHWLTAGGQRTQVLFLEEGQIQKTFQVPLKEPPRPPLPSLKAIVESMDKGLSDLEKENVFNQAIHKAVTRATEPAEKWVEAVLLLSTLGLALFGLARLSQARYRPEKVPLPAGSEGGRLPPATSLFAQRHQAMLRQGNVWETARALARQGLESALEPQFRDRASLLADSVPPLPPLRGSWWRTWRLRRRLKRLWRLAYGTEPVRISPRQLRRLGREIEEIRALLASEALQ